MEKIKLTINGKTVETEKGKTVLEAARGAGIHIPTMCAHEDLPNYGACRLCIVQIDKVRGFPTSCTTPAEDGMVVVTENEELKTLRNRVLEMMLSGHPNACLVCDHRKACEKYRPRPTKAGVTTRCTFCNNRDQCELRELSLKNPSTDLELPTIYNRIKVETSDPFMDRDYNLCILCGRCFRICEKIHGQPAIMVVNRGRWAQIGTAFHRDHVDSGCVFCGACIDICPTGTLSDRYAKWYGKAESEVLTTCALCPQGCEAWASVSGDKCVALRMKDFQPESRLCAIGRFGYAQLVNSPARLLRPAAKKGEHLVPTNWEDAIAQTAEGLQAAKGAMAIIASECELREVKFLYGKLAKALGGRLELVPLAGEVSGALKSDLASGKITAVLSAGNWLADKELEAAKFLAAVDFTESATTRRANVVLPAAILSETEGSFKTKDSIMRHIHRSSKAPGDARPEWRIAADLGKASGASGFDYAGPASVSPDIGDDKAPAPIPGDPRDKLADVPSRFRGHYIADTVCALEAVGLPMTPPAPEPEMAGGFTVIGKTEIIPNFHLVEIEAPQVARFAKPGQFVIVMAKETSERTPFTLCDWNAEKGAITLVVEEVGRSSREVAKLRVGQKIAHVTGPLGSPMEVRNFGTVALGGGCYGIGAIYPMARALKAAGNRVISVIEASSDFLLWWQEKLAAVSDKVLIYTKDGSFGVKGGVQEAFLGLVDTEPKVDKFIAIGCTFMMRMVAEATKDTGVPLEVALNPIMVDGTGMCGACRVTVGGATKFACVDGPGFDGHQVDWDELFSRRGAYATLEIEALPQGASREAAMEEHGHGGCGGNCKRA